MCNSVINVRFKSCQQDLSSASIGFTEEEIDCDNDCHHTVAVGSASIQKKEEEEELQQHRPHCAKQKFVHDEEEKQNKQGEHRSTQYVCLFVNTPSLAPFIGKLLIFTLRQMPMQYNTEYTHIHVCMRIFALCFTLHQLLASSEQPSTAVQLSSVFFYCVSSSSFIF